MPKPQPILLALMFYVDEPVEWRVVHDDTTDDQLLAFANEQMISDDLDEVDVAQRLWCIAFRWSDDRAIDRVRARSVGEFPYYCAADDMREDDPDDAPILRRQAALDIFIQARAAEIAASNKALREADASGIASHDADIQREKEENERLRDIF